MSPDPSTISNYDVLRVEHATIEWDVDFERLLIAGTVVLKINVRAKTSEIILDGQSLKVLHAEIDGHPTAFTVDKWNAIGDKIAVQIPKDACVGQTLSLLIRYESQEGGTSALQFLSAEQTTDRGAPFLFSQCEAIHARSILPCQDTPSVKFTYDAKVSVPKGLVCLMSAVSQGPPQVSGDREVFTFSQTVPIPSYLLAITVGALEKRDISQRCAVWAEKSVVDKAHNEFCDAEILLKTAEDIVGPYLWGRYDLLVLPASFPFGGMENPQVVYLTPTLLAGDRSLVNVIAHEISHCWTGNLVTNANWEHFWLNEGFTVFLEAKILGRIEGEQFRSFIHQINYENVLREAVEVFGTEHEFTKLIPSLKGGIDPDDSFSSVPYMKGCSFLLYLEQKLGDSKRFENFMRSYINKYAYMSVTTETWKEELYAFFASQKDVLDKVDWHTWLYKPGMPPKPKFGGELMEECDRLATEWAEGSGPSQANSFTLLRTLQKIAFLEKLYHKAPLSEDKMERLTSLYQLDKYQNAEIRFKITATVFRWTPIVNPALAFALSVGRMKFLKPVYKALFGWPLVRDAAVAQFEANRRFMHPISARCIAKLLSQ